MIPLRLMALKRRHRLMMLLLLIWNWNSTWLWHWDSAWLWHSYSAWLWNWHANMFNNLNRNSNNFLHNSIDVNWNFNLNIYNESESEFMCLYQSYIKLFIYMNRIWLWYWPVDCLLHMNRSFNNFLHNSIDINWNLDLKSQFFD